MLVVAAWSSASSLSAESSDWEADIEVFAAFKSESAQINGEILDAIDDAGRFAELQKRKKALEVETLAKLSKKARPAFEVMTTALSSFQEAGAAYREAEQIAITDGLLDYPSANSDKIIHLRLNKLQELEGLHKAFFKNATLFEARVDALLKSSKFSAAEQKIFLNLFAGEWDKGVLPTLHEMNALKLRFYDEVRGIYRQMREQLGKWSVEDGVIHFADDAQAVVFNIRFNRLDKIVESMEFVLLGTLGRR